MKSFLLGIFLILSAACAAPRAAQTAVVRHARWTEEEAGRWYSLQPWLLGCNFLPSTAASSLEMWRQETWDPATIERELTWAARLGMNTVRTGLHALAWREDPGGFKKRLGEFLAISEVRGIRPVLVLFDDRPAGEAGADAALEAAQWPLLEEYARDVIGAFAADERVLLWDLVNRPGDAGRGMSELPFLRAAFSWARAAGPSQPLTAGIWSGGGELDLLNAELIRLSDVISFHNDRGADDLRAQIANLRESRRPMLCTEWLRRGQSEVASSLAVFAAEGVGCFNRGLVRGRSSPPSPSGSIGLERWLQDLFEPDGRPYDPEEILWFREYAARVHNAE